MLPSAEDSLPDDNATAFPLRLRGVQTYCPVPVSPRVCALGFAASVTVTAPLRLPMALGVNVAVKRTRAVPGQRSAARSRTPRGRGELTITSNYRGQRRR